MNHGSKADGEEPAAERAADAEVLRELVRGFVPSWSAWRPDDSAALGSSGLGLDSVALLELLLACEGRFGIPFPDALLDARPLTTGTLIRHLEDHSGQGCRPESSTGR